MSLRMEVQCPQCKKINEVYDRYAFSASKFTCCYCNHEFIREPLDDNELIDKIKEYVIEHIK